MSGIITDPIEAAAGVEAQGLGALPTGLAQDVGAAFDEAITRNPMSSALRALDRELYRADSQVRRLSKEEASERYSIPGHLTFDSEIPEPVARDMYELKREELRRRDVLERSPGGLGRTSAQLAAGLVGSALDPINLASAFVPVAAPFRMAAQARLGVTGGRAAVGAIEGVAGAAMVEPIVLAVARDEQADYGVTDSLLNLAFGGVLGGGLHVASGAVGDFLARRVAARARAEDLRPSTPSEAIAGAVDDLPLEQRQQLLAAAVSDLVDGDSVRRPAQLLGDPAGDLRGGDQSAGMPRSSSSAALSGEPSSIAVADSLPGRQALPAGSQISERPEPSGSSTTRPTPSKSNENGPTIARLGDMDATSGRKVWQASSDYKELAAKAQATMPAFEAALRELATVPGARFYGVRAKDMAGIQGKLATRPANTVTDYLGGRLVVDSAAALNETLARLDRRFPILERDDKIAAPKSGYRAMHVQVDLGNGMSAELQIVPSRISDVQGKAHKLYDTIKRLNPEKLTPAEFQQYQQTQAQIVELFNSAWARQVSEAWFRPAAGAERLSRADLVELKPSQLIADATRFQFKAGGDEAGVTDRLRGVKQWDQRLAGVVLVFEDRAGNRYIADGHQRLGLAKRLESEGQQPKLNAMVLAEADGYTDAEVMVVAALKNIAEGTGSAVDAAKVFRALDANPELGSRVADMLGSIPRNSSLVRDAAALQVLSERAFGLVVNERVQPAHAAEVGRLIQDPKQQEAALEVLARLEPQTQGEARHIVEQVREAGFASGEQTTLFGKETIAKSLFLERARVADRALAQLRKDKAVFRTLVDQEGRITQAGNELDRGVNEGRLTDDEKILYAIDRLASRKGPVSDALAVRAGELAAGKRIGQVVGSFVDDVRGLVRQGLELDGAADSPGSRDQAAGAGRPATEPTAAGEQGLIAGVAPITQGDRLRTQADQPLQAAAAQKPADVGLFDVGARNQLDLVDQATKLERAAQEAEAQAQRLVAEGGARPDEPELFAIQREQQRADTTARGLDAAAFCINRRT